jgi:hypothetical protein
MNEKLGSPGYGGVLLGLSAADYVCDASLPSDEAAALLRADGYTRHEVALWMQETGLQTTMDSGQKGRYDQLIKWLTAKEIGENTIRYVSNSAATTIKNHGGRGGRTSSSRPDSSRRR